MKNGNILRIGILVGCLIMLAGMGTAQVEEEHVHIYPLILSPGDTLTDGPTGKPIRIKEKTLLLWADLDPEMRFEHPTAYVLISDQGSRVLRGRWWPELNGKRILYGEPSNYTIVSPFTIPGDGTEDGVLAHFHPLSLNRGDKLTDGPNGRPIPIVGDTMFLWIDLEPGARFVHPTLYVLISGQCTRMLRGEWWPELNGKRILYGQPSNYTIVSPFLKEAGPRIRAAARKP